LWDEATLDRPWPWLAAKISALLSTPPARVLVPTEDGYELRAFHVTRIQAALAVPSR